MILVAGDLKEFFFLNLSMLVTAKAHALMAGAPSRISQRLQRRAEQPDLAAIETNSEVDGSVFALYTDVI